MKTAYAPNGHKELASASVGKEYGHVPGHQYHDVDCVVSVRAGTYRCHLVESWGSAQGHDEEHGRREVVNRGRTILEACSGACSAGQTAGMDVSYTVQASSQAMDEAEEAEADAAA